MEIRLPVKGEVFEGRYELREVLGRGGFAIVFRATDLSMSRDVALKVLAPADGAYNRTVAQRFLREAQVFAGLEDPHTITMYDFGESAEGLLYMVFEHVRGQDLVEVLRRGALPPAVVGHVLAQLLSALREAHHRGVLHRDIKPANVLMYEYGGDPHRVKLIDFGIAKDVNPDAASITQTGRIVGTPRYMAPEQLFGQQMGPDSDLYSLGLVAFEMIAGRPAIDGASNKEVMQQQVSDTPLVLPEWLAPATLRRIVERLTARERRARYTSAKDVMHDLRAARRELATWGTEPLEPLIMEDSPPTPHRADAAPAAPAAQRSRGWRIAALTLGLAVVAGVAWFNADTPPEPDVVVTPTPRRVVPLVEASTAQPEKVPISVAPDARLAMRDADEDGCGGEVRWRGQRQMTKPGDATSWHVYLPESYTSDARHPSLLMFHNMWVNGATMIRETNIAELAERHRIVVFALDSTSSVSWQSPDEMVRMLDGISGALDEFCIDRRRIFAIGDGTGGEFVQRLSCVMPLSAIMLTASAEFIEDELCVPPTPTPRLRLYGEADRYIPAEGGPGCIPLIGTFRSAAEIDERWMKNYQCSGPERPWGGKMRGGTCRTWACDFAPLVMCATSGGHYWPGANPVGINLPACALTHAAPTFPYLDVAWDFFENEGRVLSDEDLVAQREVLE